MLRRATFLVGVLAVAPSCGARTDLEVLGPCEPTGTEICDGTDNDCDGEVDEGIAPITCGDFGCAVTTLCEDGVQAPCVPRVPEPEVCNLSDDDCDGEVDEGFGFGPVSELIVLRDDEFDTGDCSSCKWAFGTTLAPTNDGLLAMWQLGLSGGAEQSNFYGRRLDALGVPTGPIELLRSDFILSLDPMRILGPLPPRGYPVEARYRVGADDIPGLLFVDAAGETDVVMPTPATGAYGIPLMVWTGSRFVTAWEEEEALRVAVLDANGAPLQDVDVDPLERPAAITLGLYTDRVGILVSRYVDQPETRDQWFILLDALGNVLSPAKKIDLEYDSWQRLIGTEEGWLYIKPNSWDEESTRVPLDVDGDPLEAPTTFADGRKLSDSGAQDTWVPLPSRNETLAVWQSPHGGDMHVEFLDSRGDTKRGWSGPLPTAPHLPPDVPTDYLADPHTAFVGERLVVIWHGGADNDQPNRVYTQAFGCVP